MKLRSVKHRLVMFCINHIFAGTRFFGIKRWLLRSAGYEIGDGTKIVGPLLCSRSIKVGRNCWVGRDLTVCGNGLVEIGDNCDIAPGVMFLTGGHVIGDSERRAGPGETYTIRVGDGCWIGARATITKEVRLCNGCVVAACACVTADVAENTLVGGVPARPIKDL